MDNKNITRLRARLNYYTTKKNNPNYTRDKVAYNKQLYHRKKEELNELKEKVKIQSLYIHELEKLIDNLDD
jgi:hypothetical protein